ncbi:IPT/TIG domain-containing protein [Pedobacter sp. N36a]|uniref:IPT/TIG domain-containing protein n=1 Tax=Pedobacter sp. N36a TaxID=2767996 RepID=UPI00165701DF|nr:IPT/TIG domain-containing protein [Pedobacter sp. N36a]MBC8988117.1 IPT/TIG domain-containing protein [Pedobacter sp. N36a]
MNIQHKWNFSIGIMLCFLLFIGACKKDKVEVPSVPFKIDSYYPNSGNAGTLVSIVGAGFGTELAKYSASISGKAAEVISATENTIVIRMPEGGVTGALSINYDSRNFDLGQYIYQALSVKTVFPANGPAGSQIRITGAGFSSTTGPATVFINGKPALVVSVSDQIIVAEVPAEAGFGPIVVKVDGKEAKGQNFTYQAISSIKPLTGGKNTKVTINGVGFEELPEGNLIDFNGTSAIVLEATKEKLIVQAPEGVNTGPLSVNINGQKIAGPVFRVVAAPTIQVVTPLSGPKGAEMTISGVQFSGVLDENKVFINGVEIPVQSATESQIKLVVPGGTGTGVIKVIVNDQATNGPQFKDQTLGITSVSPDNGLAGTTVTIKGSGFSASAASNKVYFNGLLATVKTATENTLILDAPGGLSTGDLKVVVDGQEAIAPQDFRRAGMLTLAGGPNSDTFGGFMAGIAVDNSGNIYAADRMNHLVKKITPAGVVSVLQANGADIVFDTPYGIVIDKQDNIYVSDIGRNHIRKITPSGQNTVYVSGFAPGLMTFDNAGNMYVNIVAAYAGMNKVNTAGSYTKISGPFWPMAKAVVDANGNLFYVDSSSSSNNAVGWIPAGAGNENYFTGSSDAGFQDGVGLAARFNSISGGLALYGPGKLIAGDKYNNAIREIDIASRKVSTLVKLRSGFADGAFTDAKLGSIDDMAVDKDGNIYILDAQNKAIRKVFLK